MIGRLRYEVASKGVLAVAVLLSWAIQVSGALSVMEYGAKADGKTDDTAAFQEALAAAAGKGEVVLAPAGKYLLEGTLAIPQGVTLFGEWEAPHHGNLDKGTTLITTANKGNEDGRPFITLDTSSTIKGVTIFYPEQDASNVIAYPWCIQAGPAKAYTGSGEGPNIMHASVVDVTLINPYKGIDVGTYHNELHYIRNVFGQPLKTGIYVDRCTDIGRIENVHFNPHYWTRSRADNAPKESKVFFKYLEDNFTAFLIGKTDWEYMNNCFSIFAKVGFHFKRTSGKQYMGSPNVVLTQCGADITPLAVLVEDCQGHAGLAFSNCQIMGTVVVGPNNKGPVKFTNCGFWTVPQTNEQVIVDGSGTVMLNACHFRNWAMEKKEAACVRVDGGTVLINACDFMADDK